MLEIRSCAESLMTRMEVSIQDGLVAAVAVTAAAVAVEVVNSCVGVDVGEGMWVVVWV
jgi:hypothetical protein